MNSDTVLRYGVIIRRKGDDEWSMFLADGVGGYTHNANDACTWATIDQASDAADRLDKSQIESVAVFGVEEPRYDG